MGEGSPGSLGGGHECEAIVPRGEEEDPVKKDISIRLDTTEMIALERCLADRNAEEAFRLLKALAEKVRYAQATS